MLGLFQESAAYVLAVTLLITVTIILILHMYRPYADDLRNKLSIVEEVGLALVLAMFFILMLNDGADANAKFAIGAVIQFFGIALIMISLAYPVMETYRYGRRYWGQKKEADKDIDIGQEHQAPAQQHV